jgi:hypothetical protein
MICALLTSLALNGLAIYQFWKALNSKAGVRRGHIHWGLGFAAVSALLMYLVVR